jgi:hypothetical protein
MTQSQIKKNNNTKRGKEAENNPKIILINPQHDPNHKE